MEFCALDTEDSNTNVSVDEDNIIDIASNEDSVKNVNSANMIDEDDNDINNENICVSISVNNNNSSNANNNVNNTHDDDNDMNENSVNNVNSISLRAESIINISKKDLNSGNISEVLIDKSRFSKNDSIKHK